MAYTRRIMIHLAARDGLDVDISSMVIGVDPERMNRTPLAAVQAAVDAYLRTPDGQAEFEHNGGYFTWGDAASSLPDDICARFGFRIEPEFDEELTVDADAPAHTYPDDD